MADGALEILRAFGIGRTELSELPDGTSGAVWKVHDAGRSYVLRRHDQPRQLAAHVHSELAWLDALGEDATLPTTVPVRQANGELAPIGETEADGETRALWTLLQWVDGATLGRLPDGHEAGLIGSMRAGLHRRAKSWSPSLGFARPVYDGAHFERAAPTLAVQTSGLLDARPRRDLDLALRGSVDVLARLGRDEARVGLIHADVHDGNVVYTGEPRRAGVIDFERCGFGCWALDLAMPMHYLTDAPHGPLAAAYASSFGLTSEAEDALPNLRFLAAIDNLAILSIIPAGAEFIPAELALLTAQAERLLG